VSESVVLCIWQTNTVAPFIWLDIRRIVIRTESSQCASATQWGNWFTQFKYLCKIHQTGQSQTVLH